MKREIAVFDFDGTLTAKDKLLEFIKYTCGGPQLYIGFMLHFHLYCYISDILRNLS